MLLRNQIYKALPDLLEGLKKLGRSVKNNQEIARVAYISASSTEIGELVAKAVIKVGKDGLVTVDEGQTLDTEVEYTEGVEFDKGMLSPYFITNPQRMEAVINDAYIVFLNKNISLNNEIIPILERMAVASKNIVIVADQLGGDALATIAANKMKGNINAVAVSAPGHGDNKKNYLEDLAILTGGVVISNENPVDINKDFDWLGQAKQVVSSRESTVIIGGKGSKKRVKEPSLFF